MDAPREDINTPLIVVIGILFAILTFVLIILLQAWFQKQQVAEFNRKVVEARSEELGQVVAEQQTALNSYGWVDRDKGTVSIPIDRAMELVVREAAATDMRGSESE